MLVTPLLEMLKAGYGVVQVEVIGWGADGAFVKKCTLSLRIGPPKVPDHCWSEYGTTTCSTGSGLLNLLSRKLPTNDPEGLLVPDLVTAFTCTPDDRPWVASNRFEMN